MLTKDCRVCGRTNICPKAQYLFDTGNRKLLRYVYMLTGLRLRHRPDAPIMMCYCCQSDIHTFMTFRRQCIKAQKKWNPQAKDEDATQSETEKEETVVPQRQTRSKCSTLLKSQKEMDKVEVWEPLQTVIIKQEEESVSMALDERDQLALSESELEEESNKDESWEPRKTVKEKLVTKTQDKLELEEESSEDESFFKSEPQIASSEDEYVKGPPKVQIHQCDICGVVKNNKSSLVRHHYAHTGERPYPCKECPKGFLSGNELRAHINTQHTKEPPFPCRYCERRYFSAIGRKKHERVHTNERPFVCDQCGKAFTRVCIMRQHMLTHTGMRRFKCDICDRSFTLKKHLSTHYISNTHKRNAEKAEGEKIKVNGNQETTFITIESVLMNGN